MSTYTELNGHGPYPADFVRGGLVAFLGDDWNQAPCIVANQPRLLSRTGYGRKMPQRYKVWHNRKWKRVYAACYGNAATLYILKGEEWIIVKSIEGN